ncbi:MAG: aminoacyl--tRNA ligase-related protein, partial [Candidatus Micrarchaeota archaeon]
MKFECRAEFDFTADVSKARPDSEKLLQEANATVLKRGLGSAPESEGAVASLESTAGSKAVITVKSGRQVRAHDAVIRLRKHLKEQLGKKMRAGIRAIKVLDFVVTEIELAREPLAPVEISFFVEKTEFSGKKASLRLKDLTEELLENNSVDRIVTLLHDKIDAQYYEGKAEVKEQLWASPEKRVFYDKDPAVELEERHWICRTHAKAQFVYGPSFTVLVNAFRSIIAENVFAPLGFKEMLFPKTEPWEVPKRSGHAKTIYPDAYFVCVPKKSSPKEWAPEMDFFKITGEVLLERMKDKLDPVGILSYAQCPPFWQFFEGKIVANDSLPIKVFDWSGPTYRNEAGGTQGISRLEEFHRVETLWIGEPGQVKEIADRVDEKILSVLDKVLDLEVRKYWVTPWFLAQEGKKTLSDKASEGVGTRDYEAFLPFRGGREKS